MADPERPYQDSSTIDGDHPPTDDDSGLAEDDPSGEKPAGAGRMLLKSLLVLISCLLGYYALAIAGQGIVTAMFFPEAMKAISADRDVEEDSEALATSNFQPSSIYWSIGLLIYASSAFLAGAILTRLAPLSPIGHSILLAALLFLNALQPNENAVFDRPAWVMALFTFAVPSAVLIGAWLFTPRNLEPISAPTNRES